VARLLIPAPFLRFTDNEKELQFEGETIGEVLSVLAERYPELGARIFDGKGGLRSYVHVFLGERDSRLLQGLDTPVGDETVIKLIPAIAGG
jgi:molybdopterin converting factor small subunit